ncbi:nuclear transport factor 2 family protein [Dyella solisilvae]|uniref:Nuclear transport factor 2 family protein n=2 Tax=Dyella solisilvae TaxID=1920168 RepID=A0A370K9B0_9GAMM|nr:nuclear transport factor 2 family protein [Dyella solisilvae]
MVAMVAFAGIAPMARAATDDAATIRQIMLDQQAAWNRGDIVAFMQAYNDATDTTFIGSRIRHGYRPILENYQKNYASKEQMGTLSYSDIEVRLLPCADGVATYAMVTGRFHLERTAHGDAGKDDGVYSLLWQRTASGWKIVLDHSS